MLQPRINTCLIIIIASIISWNNTDTKCDDSLALSVLIKSEHDNSKQKVYLSRSEAKKLFESAKSMHSRHLKDDALSLEAEWQIMLNVLPFCYRLNRMHEVKTQEEIDSIYFDGLALFDRSYDSLISNDTIVPNQIDLQVDCMVDVDFISLTLSKQQIEKIQQISTIKGINKLGSPRLILDSKFIKPELNFTTIKLLEAPEEVKHMQVNECLIKSDGTVLYLKDKRQLPLVCKKVDIYMLQLPKVEAHNKSDELYNDMSLKFILNITNKGHPSKQLNLPWTHKSIKIINPQYIFQDIYGDQKLKSKVSIEHLEDILIGNMYDSLSVGYLTPFSANEIPENILIYVNKIETVIDDNYVRSYLINLGLNSDQYRQHIVNYLLRDQGNIEVYNRDVMLYCLQ